MTRLPESLSVAIAALGKLPGIGPRSAERIGLFLAQTDPAETEQLAQALTEARRRIRLCETCGALTEQSPCDLCSSPTRETGVLCVVERPTDVLSVERAGAFRGRYHVLGGRISPMNGIGPEDLRIPELEHRLAGGGITEVILALGTDVEGDATAGYLAHRLATTGARITRLAAGLPAGSGLDLADDITLARAVEGRRPVD